MPILGGIDVLELSDFKNDSYLKYKKDRKRTSTLIFPVEKLKNYSNPLFADLEKKVLNHSIHHDDIYTFYNFLKYIPEKGEYEVFVSIDDSQNVAGSLLSRTFKRRLFAQLYYMYLEYQIKNKTVIQLANLIEKHSWNTF